MAEPRNTDKPSAAADRLAAPGEPRPSKRRQVSACGAKGVFAQSGGRWVLENESELSILVGLGASREGLVLLQAMVPALNAGVAGAGDLGDLRHLLLALSEADEVCWAYVPEDLVAAVTVACAHWDHEAAEQWLCWALAERLEENLSDGLRVGAGWLCWVSLYKNRRAETWHRGTGWMDELGSEFWDYLANHKNPLVRAANAASNPKATPAQLASLAESSEEEVLDLVASHPRSPAKVLLDLADLEKGRPVELIWRAAQNLSAPKRALERLASISLSRSTQFEDHNSQAAEEMIVAQCLIALNPNTPPRALTRLSRSEHEWVLGCVACNPNTPHETMERLAAHQAWAVRRAAASNSASPKMLLARLASDARREVRAQVAANPRLPNRLLGEMALDRSFMVRQAVAASPSLPRKLRETLASDSDGRVRWEIAHKEETPPEMLAEFAADPDPQVRSITALNNSTPEHAIARLAEDPDHHVLRMVAFNPKTPPAALKRFAQCENKYLRRDVASNPSTPPAALELLADDPDWYIQCHLAANTSTPPSVLERISRSKHPRPRASVAKNPDTPIRLVEQLLEDDCHQVSAAAADTLAQRRGRSG